MRHDPIRSELTRQRGEAEMRSRERRDRKGGMNIQIRVMKIIHHFPTKVLYYHHLTSLWPASPPYGDRLEVKITQEGRLRCVE
jgi:hypothetical protein